LSGPSYDFNIFFPINPVKNEVFHFDSLGKYEAKDTKEIMKEKITIQDFTYEILQLPVDETDLDLFKFTLWNHIESQVTCINSDELDNLI
jgi:hypothetical protein